MAKELLCQDVQGRIYLYIHHTVLRVNNRNACFIAPQDNQFYLELREECSRRYGVAIHAYCLMTNHIHFLVASGDSDSVSFATKVIGRRYAQYFNKHL
jgi:putative transposase